MKIAQAPRKYGWNERSALARFLEYRMQQFAAAMIGYEQLRKQPYCSSRRPQPVATDEGNAAWRALSDEARS